MSEMKPYKVSVIVPVYRVEKYIDRCMKSLLKQTLTSIEIICICEKEDNSYQKLLAYEKKNDRVKVIEKKNIGVSAARNEGMRKARGKYIAFVDADDWIEKYALEILYETAERYRAQIIAYGIWPTIEPKGDKRGMFNYSPNKNVIYHEGMKALFYEHGSKPYIGNKFYNKKFLEYNGIVFDETMDIGEDQLLQFEAFDKAESICFIKDKLYHYDIGREASAMNTCEQRERIEDKNFRLLQIIMEQKKRKYQEEYDKEYVLWILQCYGWLVNQNALPLTENRRNMIQIVQEYLSEMSAENYIGDLPMEYQSICRRFLDYNISEKGYEAIGMPYKAYEKYMEMQALGWYEEITVTKGNKDKFRRMYEALVFHEFRHLVTKALVRFGVF